jgi:hypothetical protein
LDFPTIELDRAEVLELIVEPWKTPEFTPNWQHEHLVEVISRTAKFVDKVLVVLMDVEVAGERRPREREWRDETGFVNIFQGRDNQSSAPALRYPGDRAIGEASFRSGNLMLQIHRLSAKGDLLELEYLVPAIFLGNRRQVRTIL